MTLETHDVAPQEVLDEVLDDELGGTRPRCDCGRFAQLAGPPHTTVLGTQVYPVECKLHGRVFVS